MDECVYKDLAVFMVVMVYGGFFVDIVICVWCNFGDYWGVYFDVMKNVKEVFDKGGIFILYLY